MKFLYFILIQVLAIHKAYSINWQPGSWAFGCDFSGQDLSNVRVTGSQCGGTCASTSGCTHFTWTTYQGGTCWMKSGSVSKSDAYPTSDQTMVCGIVSSFLNGNNFTVDNILY